MSLRSAAEWQKLARHHQGHETVSTVIATVREHGRGDSKGEMHISLLDTTSLANLKQQVIECFLLYWHAECNPTDPLQGHPRPTDGITVTTVMYQGGNLLERALGLIPPELITNEDGYCMACAHAVAADRPARWLCTVDLGPHAHHWAFRNPTPICV